MTLIIVLTTTAFAKLQRGQELDEFHSYVLNEDMLVVDALERRGFIAKRVGWDDATFDWSTAAAIVIRTVWDYFYRFHEFEAWLQHMTEKKIFMMNSMETVKWNVDKHYLEDLKDRKVRICKTTFIDKGVLGHYKVSMSKIIEDNLPWDEYVVKPCVSGSARETYRLKRGQVPTEVDEIYAKLNVAEAFMVQPFQHRVVTDGEISVVVINGEVTHAVLKRAKEGDFRVQIDFGGTAVPCEIGEEEKAFAVQAVAACDEQPLYARVDMFRDNDDQLALAELELIEPDLWFHLCRAAADKLAEGVALRIEILKNQERLASSAAAKTAQEDQPSTAQS